MKNVRTMVVKYLCWTATKPARIVINDLRHRKTVIITNDTYEGRYYYEQAISYLKERGIEIKEQSEGRGYMMLHTEDFTTTIK